MSISQEKTDSTPDDPVMKQGMPLSQILKARQSLKTTLTKCYQDQVIQGASFKAFMTDIQRAVPGIRTSVLQDSVWYLAGQRITPKLLDDLCWRLAGNLNRLRNFIAVPPWHGQKTSEWCIAQLMQARPSRGRRGDPGAVMTFKLLSGLPCPWLVTKFWSSRFCRFVSSQIGFARFRPSESDTRQPSRQFTGFEELVTMRMELLIDPKYSQSEPSFSKIRCTGALLDYNKEQLKFRDRLTPAYACRHGMPLTVLCRHCPRGFVSCPAGCHKLDYVMAPCSECRRDLAPFDHDLTSTVCVECYRKLAMIRE